MPLNTHLWVCFIVTVGHFKGNTQNTNKDPIKKSLNPACPYCNMTTAAVTLKERGEK